MTDSTVLGKKQCDDYNALQAYTHLHLKLLLEDISSV